MRDLSLGGVGLMQVLRRRAAPALKQSREGLWSGYNNVLDFLSSSGQACPLTIKDDRPWPPTRPNVPLEVAPRGGWTRTPYRVVARLVVAAAAFREGAG